MKTFNTNFSFLLLLFLVFLSLNLYAVVCPDDFIYKNTICQSDTGNDTEFAKLIITTSSGSELTKANMRGDVELIGNQAICVLNTDNKTCENIASGTPNDGQTQEYPDYDNDITTSNSTAAYFSIPSTAKLIFARLYWTGFSNNNLAAISFDTVKNIKYKTPSMTNYKSNTCTTYYNSDEADYKYTCSVDITDDLKNNANGDFWVSDVYSDISGDEDFGAWFLVYVYEDETLDYKNISLYQGISQASGGWMSAGENGEVTGDNDSLSITISGFKASTEKDPEGRLLIATVESDSGYWDYVEFEGTLLENSLSNYPKRDFLNSTITKNSVLLERTPKLDNSLGVDLHQESISGMLARGATSANVKVTSGSTNAPFSRSSDWLAVAFLGVSIDLYEPQFCYDYAYSQQDIYFTEDNNGTKDPDLIGNVISGEPVEVKIFIRNLISDFAIEDMKVNITDINTTQATYETDSTMLAKIGNLIPVELDDATDLNITTSGGFTSIRGIDVGDLESYDHFYIYYSLDPKQDLNMPIKVDATYNLIVNPTTTVPYTLELGANVPMCSGGNFNYSPASGIFNVVHNNYYDLDTGGIKNDYNLPTQITSREGNFKVLSVDTTNHNLLSGRSTIVGVEMIDASAFHDVNASCQELASSISDRVAIIFETNATTSAMFNQAALQAALDANNNISSSWQFYANAKQNTAFRVSYNVTNDGNESLIQHTPDGSGGYRIDNFTELVQGIGTCSQPVEVPTGATTTTTTQVAVACGSAGNFISAAHYRACQKCLFGFNTKFICSRDNFSIRPEGIMMHIDDQNQTNPTSQSRLTVGESGVVGASASIKHLSADYEYNLELNATNHRNNTSSVGYTRSFNTATINDIGEYTWEPRGLTAAQLLMKNLYCNDDTNKSLDVRFVNGLVDANTSAAQVGEYRLNIVDKTWTAVDSDPTYMNHHTGSYFLAGLDCAIGSATQSVNSATLNGCDITSSHTNNDTGLVYNDYNVTFHPYEFTVANTFTISIGSITPPAVKPFIYMANIDNDERMSVELNTTIVAVGKNSTTGLSNFVSGCYEKALNIDIGKSPTMSTQLEYKYRYHDYNSTGSLMSTHDINGTIAKGNHTAFPSIVTLTGTSINGHFLKNMNGRLDTAIYLNFNKEVNATANPENITFTDFNVSDPNNSFSADLITKTADGNTSLNQTIIHYYARTAARNSIKIICDGTVPCNSATGGEPEVFIYYEIFCNGTVNGNTCNIGSPLLPNVPGGEDAQSVHSHWWTSFDHNTTNFGALSGTSDPGFVTIAGALNPQGLNFRLNPVHSYNLNAGLPYLSIMDDNVSSWLVYDENNASATQNHHQVEWRAKASWSGKHETNTTTKTQFIRRVNRRTMW